MKRSPVPAMIVSIMLTGCAAFSTSVAVNRPYFVVESGEQKIFQALAKKQEILALKCAETNSCDHIFFTRGLIGLYESREIAEKYFGKVLAASPRSQLAISSKAWIQLLQESASPEPKSWPEAVLTAPALADTNTSLVSTADRLVRDLLDRELLIQQFRSIKGGDPQTLEILQKELADRDHKIELLLSKQGKMPVDSLSMQSLQKQLAERDKKIEELSTQLEALKRIDQEMRDKVRPIRPPSSGAPGPGSDPAP
jgi:hypothetical protein